MTLTDFLVNNSGDILTLLSYIIAGATVFIKIFPQVDKKNKLKPVLQFIGKYMALNRK